MLSRFMGYTGSSRPCSSGANMAVRTFPSLSRRELLLLAAAPIAFAQGPAHSAEDDLTPDAVAGQQNYRQPLRPQESHCCRQRTGFGTRSDLRAADSG